MINDQKSPEKSLQEIIEKISSPPAPKRSFEKKSTLRRIIAVLLFLSLLGSAATFVYVFLQMRTFKSQNKVIRQFRLRVEESMAASPFMGRLSIPDQLQNVPMGEVKGLVLGTKEIAIRNCPAPYNGSIIDNGKGGYALFFRYDELMKERTSPSFFYSYIGYADLDRHFDQTGQEFLTIETGSSHSEDPRIFKANNELYLVYNDLIPLTQNIHGMRIGKLDLEQQRLTYSTSLDLNLQSEKNWAPFEYLDEQGQSHIYLEYQITPHKILELPDPTLNHLNHPVYPGNATFQNILWNKTWGKPRGGSTIQKVGEDYLGFFHSSFLDQNDHYWYVMAAYTFEAKPPFRVTGISPYPILFQGIYTTPPIHTADVDKRVIFPGGFVVTTHEGREVIHVLCGENDCALKIVTLDKGVLFKTLKKL